MDRRSLNKAGMQAAADLRDELDLDPFAPVDIYGAAAQLGIVVRFMGTSMEGFYYKGPPAKILLSALRPVSRRAFTCAHELGHHIFGHGSTIDQMQGDDREDDDKPDEIIANAFAAAFLMPTVGLRAALSRRGWEAKSATPLQLFTVACEYGVGYRTLVNHLTFLLREIPVPRRTELIRWNPQRIRRELLKCDPIALIIADEHNEAASFDAEVGTVLVLPSAADVEGEAVVHTGTLGNNEVYRAEKRGVARVSGAGTAFDVRIMPHQYLGVAAYRFLEDPDEQE
jgi:hypothetical protein